jgi:hypothetical protein
MYLLILLFGFFILNKKVDALNEKFCVNCQHFISVPGCNNKVGRCRLYPKKTDSLEELNYLVSGKRNLEYRFCNFAREDPESCGISGKYYMKKKKIFPFPKIPNLSEKISNLSEKIPYLSELKNKLCILNNKIESELLKENSIVNDTNSNNNNSSNNNESIPSSSNIIYIDVDS